MQKITEITKPPVVGQSYLVPCVNSSAAWWANEAIPVLGDFHSDKEIIGFPEEHIHIDFRFLSSRAIRNLKNSRYGVFATVVSKKYVEDSLIWEVRRCIRRMPEFPKSTPELQIKWFADLEKAYQNKQVNCGKCPHKGIDLRLISGDRFGNKVCPAHGLKWNKSGFLVQQSMED